MKGLSSWMADAWSMPRGRLLLAGFACLTGVGTYVGAGGSIGGLRPADAAAAVSQLAALPDPMSLLGLRSPGAREEGRLRASKQARVPHARVQRQPRERVLTTAREREGVVPEFGPMFFDYGEDLYMDPLPLNGIGTGLAFDGVSSGGSGGGAVVPFLPGTGVGGGGGGYVPGSPEVVTPVPEPATWMTMIMGFLMIGVALRRQGLRRSSKGQCA